MKVLVSEKLAEAGIEKLREHFDVEVALGLSPDELLARIGGYDGLLVRSATKVDADLIAAADRLRVIGRAGVGVDNVDVGAATKRGIVVCNAPQSNIVSAAEHTVALLLALARHVPRGDRSLREGRWDRSKLNGVELYEKTLGVLGFGRIGQLVAERALGFGMEVVAYDPFVAPERFREMGVERLEHSSELYARADFVTIHLPTTPETRGWLNADAFAQMKDGVRVVNCARGELVDDAALKDALDSGRVAGAALDVFPQEPITEHPLFSYDNVVVTPHLGASTGEAQDRAGVQTAEQVIAALTGGVVSTAVNIPAIPADDMEALGPMLPLCQRLGRLATVLSDERAIECVEVDFLGRVAERDNRLLQTAVLMGVLAGHTEEEVNQVNAPSLAQERGIELRVRAEPSARDFTDLIRVSVVAGGERQRVVGTTLGRRHRPHLLEAWGQRFNLQIEPNLVLFRYLDQPGMIGRIGQAFGERGINISQAAVGRRPGDGDGSDDGMAIMAITTDSPVPQAVVDEIVAGQDFDAGRSVTL